MALDINAIYQGGMPQLSLAEIYSDANKIRQQRQEIQGQNSLKALFGNQANLNPDGTPTQNSLNTLMRIDPKRGMELEEFEAKVADQKALGQERQQKAALERDNYLDRGVRQPAAAAYDQAIREGKTPIQAQDIAQRAYSDGLDETRRSGLFSASEAGQFDTAFDIDRVRQRIKLNAAHNSAVKGSDVETMTDSHGNTFDHDKVSGTNKFISGPAGLKSGESFDPTGGVHKVGGGGTARSAAAAATQRYLEENPDASAQDVANFSARFKATEIAGTADVKTDEQTLAQAKKMQSNVKTFIGSPARDGKRSTGAEGEADLVESLMGKGLGNLPGPAFNHLWNDARSGLGDPNIVALRNALLSLQQENAKIMEGSTGSVAAVSDHASKQVQKALDGDFNADQLRAAIKTMKSGWRNRESGVDDQVSALQARIRGENPGSAPTEGTGRRGGGVGSSASNPARPKTRDAAAHLPKGTWFVDPNGNVHQRPQ